MTQEEEHIKRLLTKRNFYRRPMESLAKELFSDAAFGYMQGYLHASFLSTLATEILATNSQCRHPFLHDKRFIADLRAGFALGAVDLDPATRAVLQDKLARYGSDDE
jgi:hypothetical protein